jgi:hypothetical protein
MRARRRPPFSSGHLLRKRFPSKERKKNICISVRMEGKKKVTTFGRPKDEQKVNTKPRPSTKYC